MPSHTPKGSGFASWSGATLTLGCGFDPLLGCAQEATDGSLPLSLLPPSPPSFLSKINNKKYPWVKIKNNNNKK